MEKELLIVIIVIFVVFICSVCYCTSQNKTVVTKKHEDRDSESTKLYKQRLLDDCYEYITDTSTRINWQDHRFEWDYHTDRIKAKWSIHTPIYYVSLYGTSTTLRDVDTLKDFLKVSTIEEVTIYTAGSNISVLHTYHTKEHINKIISGLQQLSNKQFNHYKKHNK